MASYFEVLKKGMKQQPQAAAHAVSERAAWLSEHSVKLKMPAHHEFLGCIFPDLPAGFLVENKDASQLGMPGPEPCWACLNSNPIASSGGSAIDSQN